jgi:hypothetical protein
MLRHDSALDNDDFCYVPIWDYSGLCTFCLDLLYAQWHQLWS